MKKYFVKFAVVFLLVLGLTAVASRAAFIYPLEVFTGNGSYYNSPDIDVFFETADLGGDLVDFTFYNDSLVDSSMARIYFDTDLPVEFVSLEQPAGVSFRQFAAPGNLPSAHNLNPEFIAGSDLSFSSNPPPSVDGINPGEWLSITLSTAQAGSFEDVIAALDCGDLRVGAHIIALPDGSSESAVNIPEPLSFSLIAVGAAIFLKKYTVKSGC